jgi:hypothetical protein
MPDDSDFSDQQLSTEGLGKKIIDEYKEVLYVLYGNIKPGIAEQTMREVYGSFISYLQRIQDNGNFIWAGIVSPDRVMVLFEAISDEQAEEIASKNPFLKRADIIDFERPKKWYVLFGYGL